MSNLSYDESGADYVLTEEERANLSTEESLEEIRQNIEDSRLEQQLRDAEVQALQEAAEAPTPQDKQAPTGGQPQQAQTPQPATAEVQQEQQFPWEEGYDVGDAARNTLEGAFAVQTGMLDFGVDVINKFLTPSGIQAPKLSKYENKVAQAAREISSVVLPTIGLTRLGMGGGALAQTRVGWSLGNTAFMKFLGARGVEAAASVGVGAVSAEYETGDNIGGIIKKLLPAQWDFIPDSWATLDTNGPDEKRQKSINEDLALGFLIPFVGKLGRVRAALGEVKDVFSRPPKVVGFTDKAKGWVDAAAPVADDVDEVTSYALRQEDALDELGAYNLSNNPNMDVALKGVHDLYEWNEIGMRTVDDFGIVGASLDAVRIAKNYDTVYGRLGNVISPPGIRFGAVTPGAAEEITFGLARQLKDADEYGMEAANWKIKFDDVVKQGENLAVELFDPSMSVKELREVLDPFIVKTKEGVEYVAEEGYSKLFKAFGVMSEGMSNMDIARTQGYIATSLSGQISDIAEGIRINAGSLSIEGAKERLKDNLMFLMKLQGVTRSYASQKRTTKNLFEKMLAKGKNIDPVQVTDEDSLKILDRVQEEVNVFGANLDYLMNNRPEAAEALMELYELSDGKINSIFKMNEDILNTYQRWRPIIDNEPDAPNILVQAVRANYYNSMLSSFGTGAKALFGNIGGIISEPVSYFAGAAMRGKLNDIQRGWMAYSALYDTQRKALPYAGQLFMKASQNPNSIADASRSDFIFKLEAKIKAHRKLADEQAAQGNYGLSYLIDQYENMMHMASDPVFRLIPNGFTGFDGWTNATLANAHARFRAMSELKRLGKEATPAEIKKLADAEYNSMFDTNGIIVDEAVKYNTADIALNLDTSMAQSFNELLRHVPGARMFLRFPTTMANVVKVTDDYLPLPFKSFQKDINDLVFTSADDLIASPELTDRLLSSRGFKPDKMDELMKIDTIMDLKNKTLGRKAIGTFITGTIVTGLLLNQLKATGDGFYDRSAQRSRELNSDWERRIIEVGGKRIKYEDLLGPGLANWVAMVVNTADNFDMLGETYTESTFEKLAFILGGALTEQTVMSSLRPLVEILAGNAPAFDRFAAGQINSLGPLGGLRNEMGRVLDGGLKLVEEGILAQMANRNQFLGVIDPSNRLPYTYNPITGKVPNQYTLLERVNNAFSPIKIYPGQSPEEKFLEEIEFDVSTTFRTKDGIELNPQERSELFRLMGERGYFRDRIKSIMKTAESRQTIERLREARLKGMSSEKLSLDNFDNIHYQLEVAKRDAEKLAFAELNSDLSAAIDARIVAQKMMATQEKQGIIPDVESTLNIRR